MITMQQHPEAAQSELYRAITYPMGFMGLYFDGLTLSQVARAWPIHHIEYSRQRLYGNSE